MAATVYDIEDGSLNEPEHETAESLQGYVLSLVNEWESHLQSNYYSKWDEYNRLWRGTWSAEDKTREAERSRIITPALQQAVESSVCELEEATFSTGKLFDLRDDKADQEPQDIELLSELLHEEFKRQRVRSQCSEVLVNAAVTGTGIGEVVLEEQKRMTPGTKPILEGQLTAVGVNTEDVTVVGLKPVQCKNFRIDPVATSIENAHGCAIDEFVPAHMIKELQEKGVYKQCHVGSASSDTDIEPDKDINVYPTDNKVRLLKYFGLVPRRLLDLANNPLSSEGKEDSLDKAMGSVDTEDDSGDEYVDLGVPQEDQSYWVEAVVVLANEGVLLKAEESPYMMQDRPIVAFQWDIVPGVFWGRGVCEKGYNSQKALDAEIRARIDALALTIHPMMAMDATRIPRGHTPQVRPGKMILTNGKPSDVLQSFNFGQVSQITFAQAAELQKMVQQSTGAVDASGLPGTVNGEATAAGISMSLGAIIKRQKRTLVNFQENFWIPFVAKAAHRYMQFSPEKFPVKDYDFIPSSTLGIMAREYEVSQLVQLLQTTSDQSPMYGALVQSIVENMNLSNREELLEILKQAGQPSPEEQQAAQEAQAKEMALQDAQISAVNAQAAESNARATKYEAEAAAVPQETEIAKLDAITRNLDDGSRDDAEFKRRLDIANVYLKEQELSLKSKQQQAQPQPQIPLGGL